MGKVSTSGWIYSVRMMCLLCVCFFFFLSSRRHTRSLCDWSSGVCSSDLLFFFFFFLVFIIWYHFLHVPPLLNSVNLMTSGVDRRSVVEGKRLNLGGRRIIKKKKKKTHIMKKQRWLTYRYLGDSIVYYEF